MPQQHIRTYRRTFQFILMCKTIPIRAHRQQSISSCPNSNPNGMNIYVRTHTYVYIYIRIYIYIYIYVRLCIYVRTYIYIYTFRLYDCSLVDIQIEYVSTYVHKYLRTYSYGSYVIVFLLQLWVIFMECYAMFSTPCNSLLDVFMYHHTMPRSSFRKY